MNDAAYGVLGLVVGALLGWLFGSRRTAAPVDSRLEDELRQQVAQRDSELSQAREHIAASRTAAATAEARQAGAEKLLIEQRSLHERALADAKVAQDKSLADMREAFKALSADALTQQVAAGDEELGGFGPEGTANRVVVGEEKSCHFH